MMKQLTLEGRQVIVPGLSLRLPRIGFRRKEQSVELEAALEAVERDRFLADWHHRANVALLGVNVDPLYMATVRL